MMPASIMSLAALGDSTDVLVGRPSLNPRSDDKPCLTLSSVEHERPAASHGEGFPSTA
jgi:hypothetical protein